MKRKFLTLAIVSALSAACIFGATACNKDDGGDESGVPDVGDSIQVADEAAWNAAFNAPTNCTMSISQTMSYSVGDVSYTSSTTGTGYVVGNEDYQITTTVEDGVVTSYYYTLTEGTKSYGASREGTDGSWEVREYTVGESDTNPYPYSAFTFENGKYVGTVVNEDMGGVETTVTVKIGSEGYVKYMKQEYSNSEMSYMLETSVYNINSTTYTFPAEAKQAVADYKAAHSNN